MIADDKKMKSISQEPDLWDKYCESHFGTAGKNYGALKTHYVKGVREAKEL